LRFLGARSTVPGWYFAGQTDQTLSAKGVTWVWCSPTAAKAYRDRKDFGVLEKIPPDQIFEDVDRAIEWAEDNLLRDVLDESLPVEQMHLGQSGILNNFDPDEIAALKARLRVAHPKGGVIFREGDSGTDLFIVFLRVCGCADISRYYT
jgi:hypothetical protein